MLNVLQVIEKRTVPPLDNALLEKVSGACQSIGSQILTAFEGEQRTIFQDLCLYTTEQNINRADPTISSSFSALIPITMLFGTGVLIQLILVRDHLYLRKIRLSLRRILSLLDRTRTHRRTVAIAPPARSSTNATLEPVSPTQDRKENESRDLFYHPLRFSPAHAPLPPDVLYRMEMSKMSTTSERKSDTGVELDHSPSIGKRKALSENDAEDDVKDDVAEESAKDDEESEGYSRPRKKRKATFHSQTITQPA